MKLEYLQWCDAISNNTPWLSLEEAIKWADTQQWVNEQVGWVLKETKEYILLCSEKSAYLKDGEASYGGVLKIPKTWIMKRQVINIKT